MAIFMGGLGRQAARYPKKVPSWGAWAVRLILAWIHPPPALEGEKVQEWRHVAAGLGGKGPGN
jgi:hypothetical protein